MLSHLAAAGHHAEQGDEQAPEGVHRLLRVSPTALSSGLQSVSAGLAHSLLRASPEY